MKKTYVVTFPRSGHHILFGLLDTIGFANQNYCEYYNCTEANGSVIPCSFQSMNWKQKNGCCGANRMIIKSHEFDLALKYKPTNNYLVQLRNPILSIKSWYELEVKDNKPVGAWEDFFIEKIDFWKKFVAKWLPLIDEKENVMFITYDSLSSYDTVQRVVEFLELPLKENSTFNLNTFNPRRASVDDPSGFLKDQEEQVIELLNELHLPRIMS